MYVVRLRSFVSSRLKRTLDSSTLIAIQNWLDEDLKKKDRRIYRAVPLNVVKRFLIRLASWLKTVVDKLFKNY